MSNYDEWNHAKSTCAIDGCERPRVVNSGPGRPELKCQPHKDEGFTTPPASLITPRTMLSKFDSTCFVCHEAYFQKDRIWFTGNKSNGGHGGAHGWHTRDELKTGGSGFTPKPQEPVATPQPTVNVDMEQIKRETLLHVIDKIGDILDQSTLDEMVKENVAKAVDEMRPKFVTIKVANREPKQIQGMAHKQIDEVIAWANAGRNVWMTGPAGVGKSHMARTVAEALEMPFYSVSVGAQTPMSQLFGYMDANGNYVESNLHRAATQGGLFLTDEIDAGHSGVLTGLNEVLSAKTVAFPYGMVDVHDRFIMLAAANTYGNGANAQYVSRQIQDGALTDRFIFLDIEIDEQIEENVSLGLIEDQALGMQWIKAVRQMRSNVEEKGLKVMITPRACMNGCAGLNAGLPWSKVLRSCVIKGTKQDQIAQILEGVAMPD